VINQGLKERMVDQTWRANERKIAAAELRRQAKAARQTADMPEPGPGDFVNVPRGTIHCFRNDGADRVRLVLTFTLAGIERFFKETLEPALDPTQAPPDNIDEVAARYAAAAPRYGLEFFVETP
jgi:hypothetical protein